MQTITIVNHSCPSIPKSCKQVTAPAGIQAYADGFGAFCKCGDFWAFRTVMCSGITACDAPESMLATFAAILNLYTPSLN